MAIIFQKQGKQEKKLILFSIILVLFIVLFIWWFFLRREIEPPIIIEDPAYQPPQEEIRIIDFEILRLPIFEKLKPFFEIEPFEQEIGRENPFIPFYNN